VNIHKNARTTPNMRFGSENDFAAGPAAAATQVEIPLRSPIPDAELVRLKRKGQAATTAPDAAVGLAPEPFPLLEVVPEFRTSG
jgi:hypothetical protein